MYQHTKDIYAGLSFLIVALLFGSQLEGLYGVSLVFPQALIIFLAIGGLYLVIKGIVKRKESTRDGEAVAVGRVVVISVLSTAYILLIPVIGFFVTSATFLFVSAYIFRERGHSLVRDLLISTGFTAIFCLFVWGCFVKLLNVPTPEGMFF